MVMSVKLTKSTFAKAGAALVLGCTLSFPVLAEISSDQIARLGRDLMPLGGERAGNSAGTIPSWNGGITSPPSGYRVGGAPSRSFRR